MSRFRVASISMLILLMMAGSAFAGGPFGSPEPLSKESGGLHTAVGYWHSEDKFKDSANRVIRQNQIYSEAAYGAGNAWEIYARIGVSDVTIFDAFTAASPGTTSSKNDFEENWKFFTTLGAKGFYQFNKTFGIGAFVQGTYCFRDLEDDVAGADNGVPYDIELRIEDLWDVSFGIGFQVVCPYGAKLYFGPYVYYAEAKASPSAIVSGLNFTARETTIKNKTNTGGFAGIHVPLGKGFRLDMEGQYSERFSLGAAVRFVY